MVDAIADRLFEGNPAGVCLPEAELPDALIQRIAFENNLAETFLLQNNGRCCLKWFTPEAPLCGHATLAAAYVVMNDVRDGINEIRFETKSGCLYATRSVDVDTMNFPSRPPVPAAVCSALETALGCRITEAYLSRELLVVAENESAVKGWNVDFE